MKKVKSSISMVFNLVSYKSQLLETLNCMCMLDTCHIHMCRTCPINGHHVLTPLTFKLANLFVWVDKGGWDHWYTWLHLHIIPNSTQSLCNLSHLMCSSVRGPSSIRQISLQLSPASSSTSSSLMGLRKYISYAQEVISMQDDSSGTSTTGIPAEHEVGKLLHGSPSPPFKGRQVASLLSEDHEVVSQSLPLVTTPWDHSPCVCIWHMSSMHMQFRVSNGVSCDL